MQHPFREVGKEAPLVELLVKTPDCISGICLSFLQDLLGDLHPRDFAVRLWDGSTLEEEPGEPRRFTLVLKHPGAMRSLFRSPSELSLGEAYLYDDFDIEGDIGSAFALADHLVRLSPGIGERLRFARRLLSLPSPDRARAVRPSERLDGPRPSEPPDRVGAVAITLSRPQATLASERIREAGMTGRCRVEVCDYRDVDEPVVFDKLVSVGVFEHVGKSRLAEDFWRAF